MGKEVRKRDVINVNQHCFVVKRSCHTKLNLVFDKIARLDDKGISKIVIFLEQDIDTASPALGYEIELFIPCIFPSCTFY